MITDRVVEAFVLCPLKAHHLLSGRVQPKSEYEEFKERIAKLRVDEISGVGLPGETSVLAAPLVHGDLSTHPDALAQLNGRRVARIAPVRCLPDVRVTDVDKIKFGLDGLVLESLHGTVPPHGVALLGAQLQKARLSLPPLIRRARKTIHAIRALSSAAAPRLMLNKHCETCGFRDACRQRAIDSDDLSLLSGLKTNESLAAQRKGVFTITQLSYTFRPNRRRTRIRHDWALQALSIRKKRTHVLVPLDLPPREADTPVLFLDVEGNADDRSYFLVGVLSVTATRTEQHSFWADSSDDEINIWRRLVDLIEHVPNFNLFHYGSYETTFLRRMAARYGTYKPAIGARLRERAVNALGLIHGHVHFPTFSNGLKHVAAHLGFRWTTPGASGLKCSLWRRMWVHEPDERLRDLMTTYNADDCAALRVVVDALYAIRDGAPSIEVVDTGTLRRQSLLGKFKKNTFALPELEFINSCAYFAYQRERILLRTSPSVRKALKREEREVQRKPRINRIVELKHPARCLRCGVERPYTHRRFKKTQIDLRLGPGYIKRWVTQYRSAQYRCRSCKKTWFLKKYLEIDSKYGRNLGCWLVYQTIAHRLSAGSITEILREAFGIHLHRQRVHIQKEEFAEFYRQTYRHILRRIARARMVQVDETKANIVGASGYVWVFSTVEDVAFVYTSSRDGSILGRVLEGFRGVLVSDFYAAYESMGCPQQKCLVHLIRDLNDDLFRNQLDPDLREIVQAFAALLKPIVSTIDQWGLKHRHLGKHKRIVFLMTLQPGSIAPK